jgi:EamA-like transporter family
VPLGLVFALGAAISWAIATMYMKRCPIAGHPMAVTAWQIGVGAMVCMSGMAMLEGPRIDLSQPVIVCMLVFTFSFLSRCLSAADLICALVRTRAPCQRVDSRAWDDAYPNLRRNRCYPNPRRAPDTARSRRFRARPCCRAARSRVQSAAL